MANGSIIDDICDRLSNYLDDLTVFFTVRNMKIFAMKSTITLFGRWTAKMGLSLNVQVDGILVQTTKEYENSIRRGIDGHTFYHMDSRDKTITECSGR